MRKHSLASDGLSMSQAQSISNLCNQRSRDISFELNDINNVEKTLNLDGEEYIETQGKPMPANIIELLNDKATLHATQAFLMENIKAKEELLSFARNKVFNYEILKPECEPLQIASKKLTVNESWGWEQLTVSEYNEYLEAEAFASHIGQFIHKDGKLDVLRSELPSIKTLEWIEIEAGKKTPLKVSIHHTSEELGELHKKLAEIHRKHEQKVNYFKAKVKNILTLENAKIAKENAQAEALCNEQNQKILDVFNKQKENWQANYRKELCLFEEQRQKEIETIAALKIQVDSKFQSTIDMFLKNITEEK